MLSDKERMIERIYIQIADELSISSTMYDKAVSSYNAVGKYLGDCDPDYDIRIMPQGSFYLGTIIKPVSDKDDYDIDLVCLLKNGRALSEREIKNKVGDRLKSSDRYSALLDKKEGKRCWTLNYSEFHMDMLPCVPKVIYNEPSLTDLRLTDKQDDGSYVSTYSNPYQYQKWFTDRMKVEFEKKRREFAARHEVEIVDVPTAKTKTPLQLAIQLLKRHRDIMFQADDKHAPISIIITTLAAHAYNNESSVYEALKNILANMGRFVERRVDGSYWVKNPILPTENFAEKWNTEPAKREAFDHWLSAAKKGLLSDPLSVFGLDAVSDNIKKSLGDGVTNRSIKALGERDRANRESGSLFVQGLAGGIAQSQSGNTTKKIPWHTFYGKEG